MPKIIFNGHQTVEVEPGISILDAALRHQVKIYHTCGGNCSCSTCRVLVLKGEENLSPMESMEKEVLDSFDLKHPHRLGCQSLVLRGHVEVKVPERQKEPRANKTPRVPDEI
jgi:ferredoxin